MSPPIASSKRWELRLGAISSCAQSARSSRCQRWRDQIVSANAPTLHKATALLDAYEQMWIERTTRIADILAGEEGSTQ